MPAQILQHQVQRVPADSSFAYSVTLPPLGHFIDGSFRRSSSETSRDLMDPARGIVFTEVDEGNAQDVDLAVAAALRAQTAWGRRTPGDRSQVLHAIADRVSEHAEEFVRLESANTGKPLAVSRADIDATIDTFRFFAGAVRAFTELGAANYVENHLSVIIREPLGVVGAVSPWNYPLYMAAWKLGPALAAGNSVVIKPSEQTPLTLLRFAELTADLIPPGVLNVVTGDGPTVGDRIAQHPDISMVALTGSVRAGTEVARAAAGSVKRVHLELGGKAPVVVFDDANLDDVAESLRVAGYWNSGQECGAGCRVLVHESVAEALTEKLVGQVESLIVGDPESGDDVEIGPVVSEAHFERVLGFLDRARSSGIKAAVGGGAIPGPGFYVAPTVLVDVPEGAEVTHAEIFGPVVTIETFVDEAEAVRRANEVPFGLSASLWTEQARRTHDVAAQLNFGTVWINSHLVLASEVPWGGFDGSGYGRDSSLYALEEFSRTKHVVHNHTR